MNKNATTPHETDAMLKRQADIEAAAMQLETLRNAAADQESTLAGLCEQIPDMAALERRREELLADAAIGTAKSAAADDLNQKIAGADAKKAEIEPAIKRCQQTISGLQRKMQDKIAELDDLKKTMPRFVMNHLLAEAEQIAQSYLRNAGALVDDLKRLEGIAAILQQRGHVPGVRSPGSEIKIPAYALRAFEGKTLLHYPGLIFKLNTHGEIAPWAAAEAARVKAMGIDLE